MAELKIAIRLIGYFYQTCRNEWEQGKSKARLERATSNG